MKNEIKIPVVTTEANNDSERSHKVFVDGREASIYRVVLFCAGNRTKLYRVAKIKEGVATIISPINKGMSLAQARSWIAQRQYGIRKAQAAKQ